MERLKNDKILVSHKYGGHSINISELLICQKIWLSHEYACAAGEKSWAIVASLPQSLRGSLVALAEEKEVQKYVGFSLDGGI